MTSTGSLERLNLLVVDDNLNMRRILRSVLVQLGCREIEDASDAGEALRVLAARPVDLMITDWLMEPVDGIELVRMLRADPGLPNPFLPVIMLTGAANAAMVARARDAGVNELLAKPISTRALWTRLHAIIERPRAFVRARAYVGPDRRRRQRPDFDGPERRDTATLQQGSSR